MANTYVPKDLTLMELAAVNWVLSKIKTDILTGKPSGKAIDQALDEVLNQATKLRGEPRTQN